VREKFSKPRIVVSKCLGFAHCRWNGLTISDEFVDRLKPHVEFTTTCPEVEIGLGVPRDPIRVVMQSGTLHLKQPATKADVTDKMNAFCKSFLSSIEEIDGFILKSRSPSCGVKEVKIYPGMEKSAALKKGSGFFGAAVMEKYPTIPVEDEGRLRNFVIREHFLKRIFTLARFRSVKKTQKMKDLVKFQAENKFLLMAYNQKEFRIMGRIVANQEKKPAASVYEDYESHLYSALANTPRYTSYINVLMHAMGHFKDKLNKEEKAFFLDLMSKYREGKAPLRSDLDVLLSWGVRFGENYLLDQTFFNPYPDELLDISDSGKGRNY
jgi:uncharacterized protein YbgA (DUF1722 family)/uncharacterized protein YbbK (DUF523 family)